MYIVESEEQKVFEVKVEGEDEVYEIPLLSSLQYPALKEMRKLHKQDAEGADITEWVVEHVFDKHAPGLCERLTIGEVESLITAYVHESNGADMGESSPS